MSAMPAFVSTSNPRTDESSEARRVQKELIDATRPFAREAVWKSYGHLALGLSVVFVLAAVAASGAWWPIRPLASILEGLFIVRLFILYHDFMHGAILRGSLLARIVFPTVGVLVMTPPRVWRETHNYHHAHTAKIVGSSIGSFPMVTLEMWRKMAPSSRLRYRVARHPLTILFAYLTIFMFGFCVSSFVRAPRKCWDAGLALVINWLLTFAIAKVAGPSTLVLAFLLPLALACTLGGYLFYAQHNFPGMDVQPRQSWSYVQAALHSASYIPMGRFMQYVTGNIGFHHVHHLNPAIPFYRLPEAMRAIPELQHPGTTSLALKDIRTCLSLKLWDAGERRLIGFPNRTTLNP